MKRVAMIVGAVSVSLFGIFLISRLAPAEDELFRSAVQSGIEEKARYGQLKLRVSGIEPTEKIAVLINGEETTLLNEEEKYVSAQDGSIIEIDGTGVKQSFLVEITEQSENVSGELAGSSVLVKGTIAVLANVKLK
jgi:hypothetical protein